jgi:hypothetical protein
LFNVKDKFFVGPFTVGKWKYGMNIRFWKDTWLGDKLAEEYQSLYNAVHHKNVTVKNFLDSVHLNIGFKRTLLGSKWDGWLHLVHRLMFVQLNDNDDLFGWMLTSSGKLISSFKLYLSRLSRGSLILSLSISLLVPFLHKDHKSHTDKGIDNRARQLSTPEAR